MESVEISTPYIQLDQLLKLVGAVDTGGQVRWLIEEGVVFVNGVAATERRKKLYPGDKVEIPENGRWQVVAAEA